jgi:ubiquinone/menaquinone biosynthesis C-methylase UbiE
MPFYRDHIYPYLISRLGNPEPIRKVRERIVPLAQGIVLEIGVGPGVNFVHYEPTRVSKLYALEPNRGMIRLAERQRHRTELEVEYLDLPGERIPLAAGSVDTVVSTFTLGTIPGVGETLQEIGRVLRSSGRLIFFEVGLSPDPQVRRWQTWWEPIAHWVFQGLYLTRDIPSLITYGGFQMEQMETAYLDVSSKAAMAWTHCWWGTAIPYDNSGGPAECQTAQHS